MKLSIAVAKLFLVNKTIAGLNRVADGLRAQVRDAGPGIYGNYAVDVVPVAAHTRHVAAYNRVVIERI